MFSVCGSVCLSVCLSVWHRFFIILVPFGRPGGRHFDHFGTIWAARGSQGAPGDTLEEKTPEASVFLPRPGTQRGGLGSLGGTIGAHSASNVRPKA